VVRKFIFVLALIILTGAFSFSPVWAAKKFVPKAKTTKRTVAVTSGIPAVVRYRADKLGILFSFSNFSGIDSVSYSFTYETNGMSQGAGGSITNANNPTMERELLFGTCSTSVCTYHHNLSNARLVLTAKYTNGRTATKAFRIKTYQ
jgi:hypothetical protein